jgi:hypothetical protein
MLFAFVYSWLRPFLDLVDVRLRVTTLKQSYFFSGTSFESYAHLPQEHAQRPGHIPGTQISCGRRRSTPRLVRSFPKQQLRSLYESQGFFDHLEIFHDRQRRHSSLGMLTPSEFEAHRRPTTLA